MSALVALEDAVKDYDAPGGRLRVLRGVTLRVAPGETVAVTGPSGCGKSTLLGLMAGLERVSEGRLFYKGRDLTAASEDELAAWRRASLGFVFQSHRLVPALTALENVLLPLELSGAAPVPARRRAAEALERLGLGARLGHFPHQLSGGEQQRAALARAYVHGPELILADEPTGSLDPANAEAVLGALLALSAERGAALVLVTHDAGVAARLSRRVALADGRAA